MGVKDNCEYEDTIEFWAYSEHIKLLVYCLWHDSYLQSSVAAKLVWCFTDSENIQELEYIS